MIEMCIHWEAAGAIILCHPPSQHAQLLIYLIDLLWLMTRVDGSIIYYISANTIGEKKETDISSTWVEQEKEVGLHCTNKCSPSEKFLPKILFWHLWNTNEASSKYLHGAFTFMRAAKCRKTSYINHPTDASLSRWPLKCELTCIISNRVENGTATFVLFIK